MVGVGVIGDAFQGARNFRVAPAREHDLRVLARGERLRLRRAPPFLLLLDQFHALGSNARLLIATPTISVASHANAAARLLWRAMIPIPAGPASIPAYPRVVSAGTASACGIAFWRPAALKRTCTVLEHPTPISAYPPREICHEGTTVETMIPSAASDPPPATMSFGPSFFTITSPVSRPSVMAKEKQAYPKPASADWMARISVRKTALQSSMAPSNIKTTKHSMPENSTMPLGRANSRPIEAPP